MSRLREHFGLAAEDLNIDLGPLGPLLPRWCEAVADEAMRDEAFELIRSLLDKIVLVPEGEELRIEIRGELAGILELCRQSKRPAGAGRQLSK
jgi:hypothetical protein